MGRIGPAELGILIIPLLIIYFLPTIIALSRKKINRMSIFFLNLFLGWTLVGWIVSLIWACTSDNQSQTIVINNTPVETPKSFDQSTQPDNYDGKIDNLKKLKELLDAGILSQMEFEEQKAKVLSS